MSVKVFPIHSCKKEGCNRAAEHDVKFETRRGWISFGKVCTAHLPWGKYEAEKAAQS